MVSVSKPLPIVLVLVKEIKAATSPAFPAKVDWLSYNIRFNVRLSTTVGCPFTRVSCKCKDSFSSLDNFLGISNARSGPSDHIVVVGRGYSMSSGFSEPFRDPPT